MSAVRNNTDVAELIDETFSQLECFPELNESCQRIQQEFESVGDLASNLNSATKECQREHLRMEGELQEVKDRLTLVGQKLPDSDKYWTSKELVEERRHSSIKKREQAATATLVNIELEKEANEELENKLKLLNGELDKARATFSLYRKATSLFWDPSAPDIVCRGFIAKTNDARPFSLNCEENSSFAIANHLWNLIDEKMRRGNP